MNIENNMLGEWDYILFSLYVKKSFRYIHNERTKNFLYIVQETSNNREVFFDKEKIFWRAQLGYYEKNVPVIGKIEIPKLFPYPPERMKPLIGKAKEGRANSQGIPCLYLATKKETAIQEIRPWLGSKISVAQFRPIKKLKIIDCSKKIFNLDGTNNDALEPLNDEQSLNGFGKLWSQIDQAFSKPIDLSDTNAGYVPTQILAELFKANGYDGIMYNSLFGSGKNLALFDLNLAELIDIKLYHVTKIPPFVFDEIPTPKTTY